MVEAKGLHKLGQAIPQCHALRAGAERLGRNPKHAQARNRAEGMSRTNLFAGFRVGRGAGLNRKCVFAVCAMLLRWVAGGAAMGRRGASLVLFAALVFLATYNRWYWSVAGCECGRWRLPALAQDNQAGCDSPGHPKTLVLVLLSGRSTL